MDVQKAETYIIQQLGQLSRTLYYHGLHHTSDVVSAALMLAEMEGIKDEETLSLLQTAALYHDSGFLNTYKEHEAAGCIIARSALPQFGYSDAQIETICGMIMATKIPQNPQTHLEQILCDADLDYLGRPDFVPIAATLFKELQARNLVTDLDSWNAVQVKFISAHHYWTKSALALRELAKQENLKTLL